VVIALLAKFSGNHMRVTVVETPFENNDERIDSAAQKKQIAAE
jgi:hypothetical protein